MDKGRPKMRHCEACGQADPETREGYTACCNELVCFGQQPGDKWNLPTQLDTYVFAPSGKRVKACCGAVAWLQAPKGTTGSHCEYSR